MKEKEWKFERLSQKQKWKKKHNTSIFRSIWHSEKLILVERPKDLNSKSNHIKRKRIGQKHWVRFFFHFTIDIFFQGKSAFSLAALRVSNCKIENWIHTFIFSTDVKDVSLLFPKNFIIVFSIILHKHILLIRHLKKFFRYQIKYKKLTISCHLFIFLCPPASFPFISTR